MIEMNGEYGEEVKYKLKDELSLNSDYEYMN